MKGLPQLDSHQSRLCHEGDNKELAGQAGSCKENLHCEVLQDVMDGEERRIRREKESFLLLSRVEMRVK